MLYYKWDNGINEILCAPGLYLWHTYLRFGSGSCVEQSKRCTWIMCIIFLVGSLPSFYASRLGFCFTFAFWWFQYLTFAGSRVALESEVACYIAFMRSGNSDRKQCYINLFIFFRDLFEEKGFMCIKQMVERKGKHIKLILTTFSDLSFVIGKCRIC